MSTEEWEIWNPDFADDIFAVWPGADSIFESPFGVDFFDHEIKPQPEKKIFRPFACLGEVESIVSQMNDYINKRTSR